MSERFDEKTGSIIDRSLKELLSVDEIRSAMVVIDWNLPPSVSRGLPTAVARSREDASVTPLDATRLLQVQAAKAVLCLSDRMVEQAVKQLEPENKPDDVAPDADGKKADKA